MARSIWLVATKRVGVLSINPEVLRSSLQRVPDVLRSRRAAVYALAGVVVATAAYGIPTAVIATPWFIRMTPVRLQDYVFLALAVGLSALLAASYALPGQERGKTHGLLGGVLASFAIACPVCNKIVVALLGVSGALAYFEPVQPLLGAAGIALLAVGVLVRLGSAGQCQVPVLSAKV